MRKRLRLLLIAFLAFPSFAGPEPPAERWITLPAGGSLTLIGVSGRRLRRDREIESAREDAARKALWYYGLKGAVRTRELYVPGEGRSFTTETKLEPLSAGALPEITEALRFDPEKDVFRTNNGVFVRFTCPVPEAEALDYRPPAVLNGEPPWIRRPPEIPGYRTALGFAGKRRQIQETVIKSLENAAAALLCGQSVQMETLDGDTPGRGAVSIITGSAEGELRGFMTLEIWIDPKTQGVWALAAAREIQ
jgi:hypothetical protein